MISKDSDQPTRLQEAVSLAEVKGISLSFQEQKFMVKECPADIFDAFVSQYDDDIRNVDRQKWSIFQRWRMINFLIEQGVLEVRDRQLLEVEMEQDWASISVQGA